MLLFLISSSSGLTLNSIVVWSCCQWSKDILVIFQISSTSLQLQYVHTRILETNASFIEASLLLPLTCVHQRMLQFIYDWFSSLLGVIKISMVCNMLGDIIIAKSLKVLYFNCILKGHTKFMSFELSVIYSRLPVLPLICTFYIFVVFEAFWLPFSFSPSSFSGSSSISCSFSFSGLHQQNPLIQIFQALILALKHTMLLHLSYIAVFLSIILYKI